MAKKKSKKSSSGKSVLLGLLLLATVAFVSVAVTYALVSSGLGSQTNTFTSDNKLELALKEPKWDNKDENGSTVANPTTSPLGEDVANGYSPNKNIPKDPKLTNTSKEDLDEWVAMTVDYQIILPQTGIYADTTGSDSIYKNTTITCPDYATFSNLLAKIGTLSGDAFTETFNSNLTGKWENKDATMTTFYYNEKLEQGAVTDDLFTGVKINPEGGTVTPKFTKVDVTVSGNTVSCYELDVQGCINNEGQKFLTPTKVYLEKLPEFHIKLNGYAIQAVEGSTYGTDTQSALDSLIQANKA